MQAPIYKYHIFDSEKKPLYLDANGNIQQGNAETLLQQDGVTPARLVHSPDGWKGTMIKYYRNINKWGLFRDMTVPMRFTADGAAILKYYMWYYGSEATLYLAVSRLDLLSHPDRYKKMYVSEINMSKFKQSRGGVLVEAMEGGMSKYLKAYENTKYEIPIDDSEAFYMRMDGVIFEYSRTYTIVDGQQAIDTDTYFMGVVETAKEGNTGGVQFKDINFQSSSVYPNDQYVMRSSVARNARIVGSITVQYHQDITIIARAEVNDGATAGGTVQTNLLNRAGTTDEVHTENFDVTVSVPAGHRLHLRHTMFNPVNTGLHYTVLSGEIRIEYEYRKEETNVKCISAFRLLQLLVDKITDGKYTCSSDWLSTDTSIAITCGDALRGISGSIIKTSFNDFFKAMNRWGAGMAISNDVLIIEKLGSFFGSTVSIELGEISYLEVTVAEDLMFNSIKTGYEKQDYVDVNGRYEFNQGQEWTTPKKKDVKMHDLLSPYRADPVGIELTRINFENKTTTDSTGDNDTFMLHKVGTASGTVDVGGTIYQLYDLYRPAYTSITGIPHGETYFNTEWTPKHSLIENGPYIRSILDFMDADKITFRTADRNKDLSTTIGGVTFTQSEDIQIASLGARLFRPFYFHFKTQVPITLPELLTADPYGKVSFKYNEITYYAYLMDGEIQPADNDAQTWKLLCAGDSDVTKLVKNFN